MAREATSPVGSPKIRDTFVYFVLQARTGCWGFHFKDSHSSFAAGWRPSSSPSPSLLHHTITIPPLSPALLKQMHTLVLQAHSHHTPPNTHSLVPPLTPPRQLALSHWSNSGSSTGDGLIWLHQHYIATQPPQLLGPPTLAACSPTSCTRGGTLQEVFHVYLLFLKTKTSLKSCSQGCFLPHASKIPSTQ